jgi:hypothetical protein
LVAFLQWVKEVVLTDIKKLGAEAGLKGFEQVRIFSYLSSPNNLNSAY